MLSNRSQSFLAVTRRNNREAFALQVGLQRPNDEFFVVTHYDGRFHRHLSRPV
jgi:hypothetical protein